MNKSEYLHAVESLDMIGDPKAAIPLANFVQNKIRHSRRGQNFNENIKGALTPLIKFMPALARQHKVPEKSLELARETLMGISMVKRTLILLAMIRHPLLRVNFPKSKKERHKIEFLVNFKKDAQKHSLYEIIEILEFDKLFKN
jgi:hypothetical protein